MFEWSLVIAVVIYVNIAAFFFFVIRNRLILDVSVIFNDCEQLTVEAT